ncbi:hypothetical protein AC249_AIPGENE17045 [Exaiptasia diaphana]|nr:hypothetical protein AC249_AIPGENE17045 [Exaiptasia diaphana]
MWTDVDLLKWSRGNAFVLTIRTLEMTGQKGDADIGDEDDGDKGFERLSKEEKEKEVKNADGTRSSGRQELKVIRDELMQQTPEAMHTMYERQSADEAKKKYTERKAMGRKILFHQHAQRQRYKKCWQVHLLHHKEDNGIQTELHQSAEHVKRRNGDTQGYAQTKKLNKKHEMFKNI